MKMGELFNIVDRLRYWNRNHSFKAEAEAERFQQIVDDLADTIRKHESTLLIPSIAIGDKPKFACVVQDRWHGGGVYSWHAGYSEAKHNADVVGGEAKFVVWKEDSSFETLTYGQASARGLVGKMVAMLPGPVVRDIEAEVALIADVERRPHEEGLNELDNDAALNKTDNR